MPEKICRGLRPVFKRCHLLMFAKPSDRETCIFPAETPCGWHLIGRCPVPLWDLKRGASMPLLRPGDKVSFAPVSLREYDDLLARAANGQLSVTPSDDIKDAAA